MHLRDRLFDLSRRNRMLYFRPTNSTVNLTVASVPLVMDIKNIRIDQLCVWGGDFASEVLVGEKLTLGRWLRFEDQPYLPGSLDQIIQESRRDRAEYGFSQLSLVIAFLRWHNLKEFREERITTPLLLLPVELSRKKGVRDQYLVQAESGEAEINPVLRHQLHELYGIELPDSIDLRTTTARGLLRESQGADRRHRTRRAAAVADAAADRTGAPACARSDSSSSAAARPRACQRSSRAPWTSATPRTISARWACDSFTSACAPSRCRCGRPSAGRWRRAIR